MQNTDPTSSPSLREVTESLSKHTQDFQRDAVEIAGDLRDHASAQVQYASDKVNDGSKELQRFVRDHPLTSIGIGFALGYIVRMFRNK